MRIAIGQFCQESNTYSPKPTTVETFRSVYLRRGDELLTGFGDSRVEVPAFLATLKGAGVEAVPLLATAAFAGGPVTRAAFESIMSELEARLAGAGRVDALLLSLHGAMCIEDEPDAESEIIERVARVLPPGTPIGVTLDLHGHITPRMLKPNVFYVGYREYPHIDMYETGTRVAETMLETLQGNIQPRMALTKLPLIVSPSKARTVDEPLRSIVPVARQMEAAGEILHASFFPVQPWLDIPDLGFAVLVCANGDEAVAQRAADRLASHVWERRREFDPDLISLKEAIETGLKSEGTTVVADSGDAPSGGSAADNVSVLEALLAARSDRSGRLSYLTLCDAEAAEACARAGVGSTLTLDVGHKVSRNDGRPLHITCRVHTISDGAFVMLGAGAQGTRLEQGLTAVVSIGDVRLVIRSLPAMEWDTGIYTAFGLRLEAAALVFVKSPSHFRVAFAPYARRILSADTPGPTCPNMRRLVFRNVTRPLYPLDDAHWKARA
ncbi:MAG TPA: M81 family metallopeptidase [Steroidobacteraceae bacterium]|nr:M81 family metallopeptidase [Steroidobacteraceae bacterium]